MAALVHFCSHRAHRGRASAQPEAEQTYRREYRLTLSSDANSPLYVTQQSIIEKALLEEEGNSTYKTSSQLNPSIQEEKGQK